MSDGLLGIADAQAALANLQPMFVHRCLFCGETRLLPRWQPGVRFCNAEHHRQWLALKAQDN